MDAPTQPAADEIRRLKTCIGDLVGVLGFRAIWSGGKPSRIVTTLLDVLVGRLRLDFAYARFQDPIGGASVESARVDRGRQLAVDAAELGRLLAPRLKDLPPAPELMRVPNPMGAGDVSIVVVKLGLQDDIGVLVAGCARTDFPLETERLLLNVAANQAAIGLHEGRRLSQRAMELVAANEELSREIAERKRAEAERAKLQERLRQAEKVEAIGTLAGGIAHDFNNILGAILGYGELAQGKVRGGGAPEDELEQVMQAGIRGKRLVEHILAFSRGGGGHRVPVHVQSVVAEVLTQLAASLPRGVHLERRLAAGDAAVVGDATQLHQVAMNLCTNAVQSMATGGVLRAALDRVELAHRRSLSHGVLEPGAWVRLAVSDTGCGIPPAALGRIFDPFFTTKGVGKGTGLGLSLVHGIVADTGGAIDVATREGAGTTFSVWLPSSGDTAVPPAEDVGELAHGHGESVLIVDDERPLVRLAEETLAQLGYDPAGFDSSVAALQAFRAEPERYDLILIDQTMPDLTGIELAGEVRRLRPDVPILLMSGYKGPQLTALAQAAGVGEILHKPLVRWELADSLARALSQLPQPPPS